MARDSFSVQGARIFDGTAWHDDKTLHVRDGLITGLEADGADRCGPNDVLAPGAFVVPGFVDLQVNGGGGILFNNDLTVSGIETICRAHRQYGTTSLLVTLISDTPENTRTAVSAGIAAARQKIPGFAGLHLEGPHLSHAKKGTHAAGLIRPMEQSDLSFIKDAAKHLPHLLVTLAPESVTPDQVRDLVSEGVKVSLGHTAAGLDTIRPYVAAGAKMVTHLFNAMSPLTHREPGLVGAALGLGDISCGLIADGHHVDPLSIGIALRAKQGPGHVFLVTDAMSSIGTEEQSFELNGRQVYRNKGQLTLADGTLAGADIDMLSSIRFIHQKIGLPVEEAIRMATLYPAEAAGMPEHGHLQEGLPADFLVLTETLEIQATVVRGHWFPSSNPASLNGPSETPQ